MGLRSRRNVLRLTGTAITVAIAGCGEGGEEEEAAGEGETEETAVEETEAADVENQAAAENRDRALSGLAEAGDH